MPSARLQPVRVTPWRSLAEWQNVGKQLQSSSTDDVITSLKVFDSWRLRSPTGHLPVAVEVTDCLYRAILCDQEYFEPTERQDVSQVVGCVEGRTLRLLYGMSVVRFVNFINELGQGRVGRVAPIHKVLADLGVPEWVVEVRHEVTHGTLPALSMLRLAVRFCTLWLRTHYWNVPTSSRVTVDSKPSSSALKAKVSLKCHKALVGFEEAQKTVNVLTSSHKAHAKTLRESTVVIRKLLRRHTDAMLQVLCRPGHLLLNQDQLENAEWTLNQDQDPVEIPVALQEFWAPVLRLVVMQPLVLSRFVNLLVDKLTSVPPLNVSARQQLSGWIAKLLVALLPHFNSSTLNAFGDLSWKRILRSLLFKPDRCCVWLIKQLFSSSPAACKLLGVSQAKLDKVSALVEAYASGNCKMGVSDCPDSDRYASGGDRCYTAKDLHDKLASISASAELLATNATTSNAVPASSGSWRRCTDPVPWDRIPIGAQLTDTGALTAAMEEVDLSLRPSQYTLRRQRHSRLKRKGDALDVSVNDAVDVEAQLITTSNKFSMLSEDTSEESPFWIRS